MIKKIISILLLVVSTNVFALAQNPPKPVPQCVAQAPYGFPETKLSGPVICRHAYVTLNDTRAKLPVWVSYTLTPANAVGCISRSNKFAADESLPKGQRAETSDYEKSGYDIGHMAPNGDMSFDQVAEYESFILTNMSPQAASINRGSWKLLETSIRGWAVQRNHPYVIYTGPIYKYNNPTLGQNNVIVPNGFYKIAIDTVSNEVAGWVFPNYGYPGNDLTKLRTSVRDISTLTGITFYYPANARELPRYKIWSVDYKKLTLAKRSECAIN